MTPPSAPLRAPRPAESGLLLAELIERARALGPLRTAVVFPSDMLSLLGALAAAKEGLIEPVLIGPRGKMEAAADGASLAGIEIVEAAFPHDAAAAAAKLAREGRVQAIMKGALHTDELMAEVISREAGLRTGRRVSHVFVTDAPAYEKLLFITDAAVNIAPDLAQKRDILQNAVDLARALGVARPKAAILAAVETVHADMPATIDAAALCKMADRGQIIGADVDGPLAFDNAISPEAAATKGIVSKVAGQADILLAPDLEAGNMLAKQLDYLAGAVAAGVVVGAKVPVILTSRAEGAQSRLAACAVARLLAESRPA